MTNIRPTKQKQPAEDFNVTPKGILNERKPSGTFLAATSGIYKVGSPGIFPLTSVPDREHAMSYVYV